MRTVRVGNEAARQLRALRQDKTFYACVDGGADTCLFNKAEVYIESVSERTAQLNMVGGEGRQENVKIGTAITAVKLPNEDKPVLLVYHEAMIGEGKDDVNIISCNQVRSFGHEVNDCPRKFGGKQVVTLQSSKTEIPIRLKKALMMIPFRKPTANQLRHAEHIVMTSDAVWQPADIDEGTDEDIDGEKEEWSNEDDEGSEEDLNSTPSLDLSTEYSEADKDGGWTTVVNKKNTGPLLDNIGYTQRDIGYDYHRIAQLEAITKGPLAGDIIDIDTQMIQKTTSEKRQYKDNPEDIRHLLGWVPTDTIRKTLEATTQLAKNVLRLPMRRHFKSREPGLNRARLAETYATDTFFAETKAIGGATCAQIFVGTKSMFTKCYGMKKETEAPNTLEDFVRKVGAPFAVRNDNAKAQTSERWKNILRRYQINDELTEPHHPGQNPAERRIQDLKNFTKRILDRTGAPSSTWLLCLQYACMLLNVLAHDKLEGRTPTEAAFGNTPDLSPFLQFHFYQEVLYLEPTASYPAPKEKQGNFVGVTDGIGDALTYWILTEKMQLIVRSDVRPAEPDDSRNPNKRLTGKTIPENQSKDKEEDDHQLVSLAETVGHPAETIDPSNLIGMKYVDTYDGHTQKATIEERINEDEWIVKFLHGGEERRSYNDLVNLIKKTDDDGDNLWTFQDITGHKTHPRHKWIVEVQWDNGESSWEPLRIMKESDPVTVARYADGKKLLDRHGWKWAKDYVADGRTVRLVHRILKANRKGARTAPVYKFGHAVPRNTNQADKFDANNNNKLWTDAIKKEMDKMAEFKTFRALPEGETAPAGYQRVPTHMCFDVKWDRRHKARLVAGGNWTSPDFQHDFNGTVSAESIKIGLFMAANNNLDVMVADISNAYLYADTKEKVYTIGGPEFGNLQGRTMIIDKACYGLRASNAAFGEHLSAALRKLRWKPSRADPKLWYRDAGDHYELLATYVDDLIFFS